MNCNHIFKVRSDSRLKKCLKCDYVKKDGGHETRQWGKLSFPNEPYLQWLVANGLL